MKAQIKFHDSYMELIERILSEHNKDFTKEYVYGDTLEYTFEYEDASEIFQIGTEFAADTVRSTSTETTDIPQISEPESIKKESSIILFNNIKVWEWIPVFGFFLYLYREEESRIDYDYMILHALISALCIVLQLILLI